MAAEATAETASERGEGVAAGASEAARLGWEWMGSCREALLRAELWRRMLDRPLRKEKEMEGVRESARGPMPLGMGGAGRTEEAPVREGTGTGAGAAVGVGGSDEAESARMRAKGEG